MTAIEKKEKVELLPPNLETARLPEFFPAVRKACREPAAKFFYCFTEEGESKTGLVSTPFSFS
jgi:hypothetical protein